MTDATQHLAHARNTRTPRLCSENLLNARPRGIGVFSWKEVANECQRSGELLSIMPVAMGEVLTTINRTAVLWRDIGRLGLIIVALAL